jgi:hypothetical protein
MSEIVRRPAVIAAGAVILACGWVLLTNWGPVAAGHPSYVVFYVGLLAIAAATIGYATWKRSVQRRLWPSIVGAVLLVGLSIAAMWLSPFGATDVALDAMVTSTDVTVTESATRITLEPAEGPSDVGLIFYPGARVDARAYAHLLGAVAGAGHRVVIVKEPLGIAFFATSAARSIADADPEVARWVVGGHSLGGVVAGTNADDARFSGILFYASYPVSSIADTGITVSSVYGLNDAIAEPAVVEASASDLPPDAVLVPIPGAVHSFFGDYGNQPGDGQPGVPREQAQAEIAVATLDLLARVGDR